MKSLLKTNISALAVLGMSAGVAMADQVILDDLIVDGSICAGLDCNNGESFGFDTLRLKENNLRIHFEDTSTSASFPSTDWRIIINDSANGGSNHFSIEDSSTSRVPFRVEGGGPSDALVVEADGDIGIKTRDPVVDLHITEGNTPTVRLEQDGSDGFAPQTFDIAANESNFFVRDVTHGSKLVFRIRPDAPEDSIYIAADGDIGMGTSSPESPLHIRRSGAVNITLQDNSAVAAKWQVGLAGNNTIKVSDVNSAGVQFRYTADGHFNMGAVTASPVTNRELGSMYNDDSGALCWYDGATYQVVAGAGTCN